METDFNAGLFNFIEKLVPGSKLTLDKLSLATGQMDHARSYEVPHAKDWLDRMVHAVRTEHPAIPYVAAGGQETVLRLSDFMSHCRLRDTLLYNEVFRPMTTHSQVAVLLPIPGTVSGLTINRDKDFADRDMELMRLISPHIVRAHANSQIYTALQHQGSSLLVAAQSQQRGRAMGLTEREAEVLYWVAQGKRDREIGIILEISHKTVGKHIENILAKLGAETRGAAAAQLLDSA